MDAKKKKNKKKKGNNQSKVTNDVANNGEQAVLIEEDGGSAQQQAQIPKVPSAADVQSVGVSESDVEVDRHKVYEEKFVKLQEEIRVLEDERSGWLQQEARLDEKVKLLQNDVDSWVKREANLEEKLKTLESRNDFFVQKEATLEERLKMLETINDSFIQKEAILEDKVKHIEGSRDSWSSQETFINGMQAKLDEVYLRLQEEVKELKESRDSLVQENIQLKEIIAVMESRIQHIEMDASLSRSSTVKISRDSPEEEIPNFRSESAPQPPQEQLVQDKNELVVKGREVHTESDQESIGPDHVKETPYSAIPPNFESLGEELLYLARNRRSFEIIHKGAEEFGHFDGKQKGQSLGTDDLRTSSDTVMVPLHDDVQVEEPEKPGKVETKKEVEAAAVPISDAPLIGAPFRVISFFAKFVSGADLVQRDKATSG